ncbi:hypothetical protein [Brucella anthropi]|uniref:hypothetical protein n=1 Tax=Brucella anthropi TaxID=529 RepID=UPI0006971643|nr:hypothetical protein [Brucella anthropi]
MVQRVYLVGGTSPRLITSKTGYDATPSLADQYKTFDSNWFNGGGIKFRYYGSAGTNFVWNYPYALSFIPKFAVQYHAIWNGDSSRFNISNPGQPGFSSPPPSDAVCLYWQGFITINCSVATAVAYNNRVALNNTYWTTSLPLRASILVFEA